jgi:hydrophobe/amphiphile efflux-1 (HAE1) family protein
MRAEFGSDRDLANASNDVREAVNRVVGRLPDGVEDLFVVKAEQDARPVIEIAVWSNRQPTDVITRRVNDEIIPELTAVDGVADVVVFGERERVLRIELSPERLAAFGMSIGEVIDVLKAAQFDVPVGSFEADQMEVLVRADATVVQPERIEELVVRDPVRLGQLGQAYFGLAEPESIARLNGRVVLNLGIVRQAQSNTLNISTQVNRAINRLSEQFPELQFELISDDAVFIRGAIQEVVSSLFFALCIVIAVIWLFLGRLSTTLVPAVAIPITLTGSLAAIWLLGFSVNLITLLALVLATGLVVDDAIIVTENIQRRRSEGMGAKAAAVIGTRQVFFAVLATTATLVAVFLPISFLPSDAGRLFAEFGLILATTVVLSSFVALTICPMLSARLPAMGASGSVASRLGGFARSTYLALLRPVIAAPLVSVVAATLIAASSWLAYHSLGEELVPPEDRGTVNIRMQGPDGTSLAYTDRQVEIVERAFQPWIDAGIVEALYSITGRYDLNRGQVSARLVPWDQRTVSQADIESDMRPKIGMLAGAQPRIQRGNSLGLRRGSDGGLSIALTGPNYPLIADAANDFARRMEGIAGLSGVRVQYQATQPQLSITIDRARAADLGVSMTALSATLNALVDEDEVTELTLEDEAIPIIVQSEYGTVRNPSDLLNLYVRSQTGQLVPLSQLVSFFEQGVAAELDRHGQRRAIEIDASLAPQLSLREAVTQVRSLARETLPDGIGLLLLGESAALDETSNALFITYVIALVVVFLVLIAQFESILSAAVIMITVPFGVAAAVFALWLTGTTINIYSQIGVLLLIGVMAKNGILMVEFAEQLRDAGKSATQAALEAAAGRARAISMTLVSTVLAVVPLIISSGPGSEARQSIGWVIFGGLGLAAVFTLFLTPAVYALIAGLSRSRTAAGQELQDELDAIGTGTGSR